jgi:vacuolar protein sorting-associated protein IST1
VIQPDEDYESDGGFDELDLPEVPKAAIRPVSDTPSTPDIGPHVQSSQSAGAHEFSNPSDLEENPTADAAFYSELKSSEPPVSPQFAQPSMPALSNEKKQFVPFASPPPFASASSMERNDSIPFNSPTPPGKPTEPEFYTRTIDEVVSPPQTPNDFSMFSKHSERVHSTSPVESRENIDLDDVLSAAQTAADSAERAASAARAAANLAQLRIADLKKNSRVYENYGDGSQKESHHKTEVTQKPAFDHQDSFSNDMQGYVPSHVPQRSPSLEDDPYFSYPNLFSSKP